MDEQKTLTLDFVKSLMEPAYTLVWTDYNDNLDDHRGLIQKCLDNKNCEELWEKADEWYSDAEWEAVREIIAKLKEGCTVSGDFDEEDVDDDGENSGYNTIVEQIPSDSPPRQRQRHNGSGGT